MERYVYDMVIDWIAAGLDPEKSTIFIQSRLPEHAELFTLLAMGTPLGWLERVPTYKDQIDKLKDRDLATYGFLGYPLLQAADILIYKAAYVPVGEDQARTWSSRAKWRAASTTCTAGTRISRPTWRRRWRAAQGRPALLREAAQGLWRDRQRRGPGQGRRPGRRRGHRGWTEAETETLLGHLRGSGKRVLTEPQALHTEVTKLPGLDGAKMSKSYGNAIAMREEPAVVRQKVQKMPTDPARVRRTDPGNPEKCPVWQFHQVYSDAETRDWVVRGCTTAGIGCLECKQPVIDGILEQQAPWRERAEQYLSNPKQVHWIVEMGTERARTVARQTMRDVREAMGLNYG
jgi:tryptophanyl-tRNA synthetase